mmetsp:Transcript_23597/g.30780  ORF Transcript_23597/g.30780 Transcript_23597/m.30780 type:complete len:182 (+) Transcript_23597:181-726(+)
MPDVTSSSSSTNEASADCCNSSKAMELHDCHDGLRKRSTDHGDTRMDTETSSKPPVYLDIRGTPFECCREKLMNKSSYFKRMLSSEDDDEEPVGCNPLAPIFLDYDAVAFEIVLDYIEDYQVNLPRDNPAICKATMMIAQKLGCPSFLVCCLYGTTPATQSRNINDQAGQQAKRRRRSLYY